MNNTIIHTLIMDGPNIRSHFGSSRSQSRLNPMRITEIFGICSFRLAWSCSLLFVRIVYLESRLPTPHFHTVGKRGYRGTCTA